MRHTGYKPAQTMKLLYNTLKQSKEQDLLPKKWHDRVGRIRVCIEIKNDDAT